MTRRWTKAQAQAIAARKGPLLVSAAAGSGKTTVLVERVVEMICDPQNPVDADRLLVVTYTNAAAAELKQRIGARLAALGQQDPGNVRLMSQQAMLSRASIGTIHAFCLELVRENFHHLPIAHDAVLSDESELAVLRQDSAREVLESFYAREEGEPFLALVELLSSGRDDSRLLEVMLRLYDFARSHPFYQRWLEGVPQLYAEKRAVEQTGWGATLLQYAADTLDYCIGATAALCEAVRSDAVVEKAYGAALFSDLDLLRNARETVGEGDWDRAVVALREIQFVRLGSLKGNEEIKARVQGTRGRVKKLKERLAGEYLNATQEEFVRDMQDLAPKISTLFEMVKEFDRVYAAKKAAKKRLDFSDLEHFALHLLAKPGESGAFELRERAVHLSQRYDYVLVDEYQDVNEVQETIFCCVSRMQENLFMVGDAKQSIYSFRLATPRIFLEKRASYAPYSGEEGAFPAWINLDSNFRSRREITDAVNFVFSLLMSRRLGDIRYGEEEALRCGAEYPDAGESVCPELLILDAGDCEAEEENAALEARLIARRIHELLEEGHPVTGEDGALRPCRPGDFCILMRSPKRRLPIYVKILEQAGLPVWSQNSDGFLRLREISMVLSLLEALNNPLLDLPLVAALMSPLFAFSDTEIAAIRLAGKGMPFYRALQAAAGAMDGELSRRCAEFLALFHALRARAAVLPLHRLLLEVYDRTDALCVAQVMPMGENRRANLLLLVEYAAKYHDLGYKQLSSFVDFLDRLRERGEDLPPAGVAGENTGAVQIMSVHRSKGLEFPIVILADTAKRFNLTDLNQSYQLHSRFGFACARRDPETLHQYATLPMQAIRLESRKDLLGEEMRILYVAMTRAREKLIVTGCVNNHLGRKLERAAGEVVDGHLNPRALEEAHSPLDWMLAAMLHHPDGAPLRERAGPASLTPQESKTRWRVEVTVPLPSEEAPRAQSELPRLHAPDSNYLSLLEERCSWQYPYAAHTTIPTKLAVSSLTKAEANSNYFIARPRFLGEKGLTGAERGNALHKFMQFADYHRARDDLSGEIRRMREQNYLSLVEAESLSFRRLQEFFHGPLAARIFASGQVWREMRFLGEYGKELLGDVFEGMDEETKIALQGVADCVFVEEGQAVIVDYKTDRVESLEQLSARYGTQLRLYRRILGESLPVPVGECLLYSFALGRTIQVK